MEVIKKYNFIVADDHSIVRQGMSFILKDIFKESEVLQTDSFSEIIKTISKRAIDLLVLDVNFPEGSSFELLPTIKMLQPNIKILIFSAFDEDIYAIRFINAGANGYLNKLSSEQEIRNAIQSVITTGKYVSEHIQNKILDTFILNKPKNPLEELSNREIEIARLLVDGNSNTDIANLLNLKKTTVSTYKNRIFEKLLIDNLSSLIQIFNIYYK